VDGKGRTPASARIFREPGKTLMAVGSEVSLDEKAALAEAGAELLELPAAKGQIDLKKLLKALGEREVTSVLVEGGGTLLGSLFDSGLVDKVVVFIAPIIIGGETAKTAVGGKGVDRIADSFKLERVRVESFGEDLMVSGYVGAKRG
jgi:diaminohydroxyphosphoribosylaminopyrimidine deaminase/5-amino-6-(5-phosphoribosylamino)uracil reductase